MYMNFSSKIALLAGLLLVVSGGWLLWEMRRSDGNQNPTVTANAGVLRIEMPERVDTSGPFTLSIIMDSQGEAVNAVGTYLEFDNSRLEILEMDTSQSFCQFYPENKFNNDKGTVSIACGAPSPGYKGESTIVKLRMLARSIGNASITVLPKSQILLNDGKGTNILQEFPTKEILIAGGI